MNEYNLNEVEEKLFGLLAMGKKVAKVKESLSLSTYGYKKLVDSVILKTGSKSRNEAIFKLARIKSEKMEK